MWSWTTILRSESCASDQKNKKIKNNNNSFIPTTPSPCRYGRVSSVPCSRRSTGPPCRPRSSSSSSSSLCPTLRLRSPCPCGGGSGSSSSRRRHHSSSGSRPPARWAGPAGGGPAGRPGTPCCTSPGCVCPWRSSTAGWRSPARCCPFYPPSLFLSCFYLYSQELRLDRVWFIGSFGWQECQKRTAKMLKVKAIRGISSSKWRTYTLVTWATWNW